MPTRSRKSWGWFGIRCAPIAPARPQFFKTKAELLARYDTVFTAGVLCAIKSATLADVWGNWRGFTVGAGVIWWDRIIPNSAANVQPSDLAKYPFGVFGVNHSPETDKQCPANQDVPLQK